MIQQVWRFWADVIRSRRLDDIEGFVDLDSEANRRLIMVLIGSLVFSATAIGTIVVLPYADRVGLGVDETLIRSGLAMGLAAFALAVPGHRVPTWVIDALMVVAVAFISFMVAVAPMPMAGYLVLFYLWPTVVSVVLRSERAALAHLAIMAVFSGSVFLFDETFVSKIWWSSITIVMAAMVWWSTGWMVRRARNLAAAERDTRQRAEQAVQSIADLNEQKSRFLGAMSHELRTPLNAVIGCAEMLRRRAAGPLNESQAAYVDDIVDSGRHLLALVDDTLDDAKVDAGEYQLEVSCVTVGALVEDAVRFVRQRAARSQIALDVVCDADGEVDLDERKVRQVLANLLSNAVKFTPAGGRIRVEVLVGPDDTIFIVDDTGPGIAAAAQETIFEEFEQLESASAGEGTGLGLAVARAFVELHGGRIEVGDAPTGGARFSFWIPRSVSTSTDSSSSTDPSRRLQTGVRAGALGVRDWFDRFLVFSALLGSGIMVGVIAAETPGASRAYLWFMAALTIGLLVLSAMLRTRLTESVLAWVGLSVAWATVVSALAGVHLLGPVGSIGALTAIGVVTFTQAFGGSVGMRRPGITHAGVTGVGTAIALAVTPGNSAPLLQWSVVMSTLAVLSVFIGSLLDRLQLLAEGERGAAERAGALAAELDAVGRHKSQFLAGMSHELRTPLNAVIGFGEALQRGIAGELTAEQTRYADDIVAAGRHLLDVINQTLDLAKIDAGRLELDRRPVELRAPLDVAVRAVTALAHDRSVSVDVRGDTSVRVSADESRLTQSIVAITRNAVQYAESAVVIEVGDGDGRCVVSVVDDGPGISAMNREAVFEPFHQGHAAVTRAREGAGLGLALARRLVELHGGAIDLVSAPGEGATFLIALPYDGARSDDESATTAGSR